MKLSEVFQIIFTTVKNALYFDDPYAIRVLEYGPFEAVNCKEKDCKDKKQAQKGQATDGGQDDQKCVTALSLVGFLGLVHGKLIFSLCPGLFEQAAKGGRAFWNIVSIFLVIGLFIFFIDPFDGKPYPFVNSGDIDDLC